MSVTEREKGSPRQTWTLGDSCISMHLGTQIDPVINVRCIALADAVERLGVRGVRDVVPTYNAVTVHFDPLVTDSARLTRELERLATSDLPSTVSATRTVEIPVVYGGESGPDLGAVAEFAKCSEEDVVRLHTSRAYRVYMLGFLPGFAYMGSVDSRIAMPRLDAPRLRVVAGSVGIAASQTGIYPCDTPGGWRIIGRASTKVFDATRREPFLLRAGDSVTFVPV
jgi:inhibitor of KinA